ncbi:MAG TPA: class I SAM-dependent methyltransferase [Candidatus Glassbacteria bacterium]|nr:class I SAM-dependent methyltransferase [Candidatus Glassbacteria bacterium]
MNEDWNINKFRDYKRMRNRHKPLWEYVDKFIKEKNIKSILDVGCGNCKLYNFSGDWTGIDVNTTIKNDKIIEADFLTYKFDREFEMVLIAGVVEHYSSEMFKQFVETALKVRPKYVLVSLFIRLNKDGNKSHTILTSISNRKHKMTIYGKKFIEKIMENLGLNNYSIEELSIKNNLIIIRRN